MVGCGDVGRENGAYAVTDIRVVIIVFPGGVDGFSVQCALHVCISDIGAEIIIVGRVQVATTEGVRQGLWGEPVGIITAVIVIIVADIAAVYGAGDISRGG